MSNIYYTGIGSREAPIPIICKIINIANYLGYLGLILRSGGANGCDAAFETGSKQVHGKQEIYLPWYNFNNNKSHLYSISKDALELASNIHPAWNNCKDSSKKLHARNCYQVLGEDLQTPSKFVICYTKDGLIQGGTATAINLAIRYDIPVYNLGSEEYLKSSAEEIYNIIKFKELRHIYEKHT